MIDIARGAVTITDRDGLAEANGLYGKPSSGCTNLDKRYYEHPYYIVPDGKDGEEPFAAKAALLAPAALCAINPCVLVRTSWV